jgi:RNA polymerase sigma-70 factor (ECF subfamily)
MVKSEGDVIKRAGRGDPLAWEQLVKQHAKRIYSLCYRFVGQTDQAEKLTEEVFLWVFGNLHIHRPEMGNFLIWVVGITRNLLIDHYRKSKDEHVTTLLDETGNLDGKAFINNMILVEPPCPQGDMKVKAREALLHRALQLLSPELREAVILRDLEAFDVKEIGAVLKIPEGTVKSRINRGRVELAKFLRRYRTHSEGAFA